MSISSLKVNSPRIESIVDCVSLTGPRSWQRKLFIAAKITVAKALI